MQEVDTFQYWWCCIYQFCAPSGFIEVAKKMDKPLWVKPPFTSEAYDLLAMLFFS